MNTVYAMNLQFCAEKLKYHICTMHRKHSKHLVVVVVVVVVVAAAAADDDDIDVQFCDIRVYYTFVCN